MRHHTRAEGEKPIVPIRVSAVILSSASNGGFLGKPWALQSANQTITSASGRVYGVQSTEACSDMWPTSSI